MDYSTGYVFSYDFTGPGGFGMAGMQPTDGILRLLGDNHLASSNSFKKI
jgi:hypothetical protein